MKLLILGGTVFLGRALVEAAAACGHTLTLFNRGQHNPDLFPEVERLHGDRDGGLDALRGRTWDAVIDTCGYVPRIVGESAALLADSVGHYTFISSISVFANFTTPSMDENGPLTTMPDPTVEEVTGDTYGALKALSEQAAEQAMPGRALIIRPGLIVGPHDPTDRFTYWPHRVARGGDVLAPGSPEQAVQFIDVRDLAAWTIAMVEVGKTGVFNATGPDYRLSIGRLLDECKTVSGSDARLVWVSQKFLLDSKVEPWSEIPLWVPAEGNAEWAGFAAVNCGKAIAGGLRFRPLAETIRDTLAWDATRPADDELRAGLKREREAAFLRDYARQKVEQP